MISYHFIQFILLLFEKKMRIITTTIEDLNDSYLKFEENSHLILKNDDFIVFKI